MRDYVDVKPRQQHQPESWLESIAAGIACVVSVIVFCLIVLMLGA